MTWPIHRGTWDSCRSYYPLPGSLHYTPDNNTTYTLGNPHKGPNLEEWDYVVWPRNTFAEDWVRWSNLVMKGGHLDRAPGLHRRLRIVHEDCVLFTAVGVYFGCSVVYWTVIRSIYNIINSSPPPGQNAATFADDIFQHIFMNENVKISIRISLKFVPKGPIDDKSALVQVMAWRRTGDKSLPETMLTQFTDAYMRH